MDRRQAIIASASVFGPPPVRAASTAVIGHLPTADHGGWPTLAMQMADREGLWLIDTGASEHAIDARVAEALKLSAVGRRELTTVTGTKWVREFALPALRSGTFEWGAATALEIDLRAYEALTGVALVGILGMPLWARAPWSIDFAAGRLATTGPLLTASAEAAPLTIDHGLPVVQMSLGAGPPEPFLLDTGNPGALVVFPRRAAELLARSRLPRLRVDEIGGSVQIALGLLDSVEMAGQRLEQVPVVLAESAAARQGQHFDRLSGSVGAAMFDGGRLDLDAPSRRWRAIVSPMPMPGGFGFTLRSGASAPTVRAVIDGGPAAAAQVRPGDELIEVESATTAGMTPAQVWTMLRHVGRAAMRWRREGTVRQATLARERFFPRLL
mgnify:CR=1 FL=1